jgi:hypothetical protein
LIRLLARNEANGGGRWIILSQPLFTILRDGFFCLSSQMLILIEIKYGTQQKESTMIVIMKSLNIQSLLVATGVLSIILFTSARPAYSDSPVVIFKAAACITGTTTDPKRHDALDLATARKRCDTRPENAATARLVRPVSSTASYARGSRKSIRTSLRNVERESSNSIQRESTNSIVSAWGSGPMTPGEQKSNKRRSTSGCRFCATTRRTHLNSSLIAF